MSTKLKASLEEALQAWADKAAESEYWLEDTYWGDTMISRMAEASYAVIMGAHEAQLYAQKEGGD